VLPDKIAHLRKKSKILQLQTTISFKKTTQLIWIVQ